MTYWAALQQDPEENCKPIFTRAVVIAYVLRPDAGSEPGAGWLFLTFWSQLSTEVFLITRDKNSEFLRSAPDNVKFIYVEAPKLEGRFLGRFPFRSQINYLLWVMAVRRYLRLTNNLKSSEIYHHVTFSSDWLPPAIPGELAPYSIWGPVGGATPSFSPPIRWLGVRGKIQYWVRLLITGLLRKVSLSITPSVIGAALANNPESYRALCDAGIQNVSILNHSFARVTASRPTEAQLGSHKKLVGVGRLVPWKGWALALEAVSLAPPDVSLTIIGEGKDEKRLRRKIRALGLENRVQLAGGMIGKQLREEVAGSDAVVHPSFHDSSPFAVAEALGLWKPVIGLDLAGTGHLLVESGSKPVPHRSENLVADFSSAMLRQESPRQNDVIMPVSLLTRFAKVVSGINQLHEDLASEKEQILDALHGLGFRWELLTPREALRKHGDLDIVVSTNARKASIETAALLEARGYRATKLKEYDNGALRLEVESSKQLRIQVDFLFDSNGEQKYRFKTNSLWDCNTEKDKQMLLGLYRLSKLHFKNKRHDFRLLARKLGIDHISNSTGKSALRNFGMIQSVWRYPFLFAPLAIYRRMLFRMNSIPRYLRLLGTAAKEKVTRA